MFIYKNNELYENVDYAVHYFKSVYSHIINEEYAMKYITSYGDLKIQVKEIDMLALPDFPNETL